MNRDIQDHQKNVSEKREDARDLLSKLYREIGISAVAAALEASKDLPAALPQENKAEAQYTGLSGKAA